MNQKIWMWGLVGVVGGIALTIVAAPTWGGMMGYRGSMAGSVDAHFIEQMIPHHEDAITMADMALEKAQHAEITQLAKDINRTQSEEIEKMRQWYQGWFGTGVPDTFAGTGHGMGSGMMHMGMMGDATDVSQLETATDFDKAFIEEMIPHHQMAVMMAQMLKQATSRPEMQQLAEDIIEAQTREIDSMRGWYREWYGQ